VVGHEALDAADADGLVDLAPATALLAERGADAAADGREGVAFAVDRQSFGVATLRHQRQVGRALDARRTGVDALGPHQGLALARHASMVFDVLDELVAEEA